MAFDYGYGELENQMIDLLRNGKPDFEAAEELIRQGADLNATGENDDENVLSTIILGYWYSNIPQDDACDTCEEDTCQGCEHKIDLNPDLGTSMCKIIQFFLAHGFDVDKRSGCYGAQCLHALTLSTFDHSIIDATKILLKTGAKNRTVTPQSFDEDDTPWSYMAAEGSFRGACDHDYALANVYEAVNQIYQAVDNNVPYEGIDSYEAAIGQKILKVLAENDGNSASFYPLSLPGFAKENCFNQNLYFIYDTGILIATQYGDFWTDTRLPDTDMLDVSNHFKSIVGSTIEEITFDSSVIEKNNTIYGQPITSIAMDCGLSIKFSINYGQVDSVHEAAYYEIATTD